MANATITIKFDPPEAMEAIKNLDSNVQQLIAVVNELKRLLLPQHPSFGYVIGDPIPDISDTDEQTSGTSILKDALDTAHVHQLMQDNIARSFGVDSINKLVK